jgi:hypothetical protein
MVGGTTPLILFSQTVFDVTAPAGTVAGVAHVSGRVSGTKSWSLSANSSGTYAIAAGTGIVTILSTNKLAAEVEPITVAVTGLKPTVTSRTFGITVNSTAAPVVAVADPYFWLGF